MRLGLLGIDLQDEPGTHELTVDITSPDHSKQLSYNILVVKEKFRVEHLKLPKDKVDLDDKSLARWRAEQEQVKAALKTDSQMKLWQTASAPDRLLSVRATASAPLLEGPQFEHRVR